MAAKSGILGLGSRLYPGNMQRILNKDLTRFMQSFPTTPKSSKQKKDCQHGADLLVPQRLSQDLNYTFGGMQTFFHFA